MTKNSKKVELIEVARRYFGPSFGTEKHHDKSITCRDLVTDGTAIIYRASTTYENVDFTMDPELTAKTNIDEKTVRKACTPYMFMERVTVPASLYSFIEVSQSKHFSLAVRGRWCAFNAFDPDFGYRIQDGAEIDIYAPETRAYMFHAGNASKFFKRFKVTAVKIGFDTNFKSLEFEFTFKGEAFRAVLLNCYDDETGALQECAELVESWAADDPEAESAPETVEVTASAPREAVAAMAAHSAPEHDEVPAGVNIRKNEEHDGTEVYFDRKPCQDVRDALKAAGYRWHGVKKCWYGKLSEAEVFAIIYGTGKHFEHSKTIETQFNTEPRDVAKARQLADIIVSEPEEKGKYNMPDHWRKVWKAAGIKGVTVRNNRGGWSYHFTFTFRLLPGDVLPFDECREAMEKTELDDLFRYDAWIKDPDTGENAFRDVFWTWDADKRQRAVSALARENYERTIEGRTGSICHYWQVKREKYPMFTEQFWDRWELVGRSVSCHNYDNSDPMTDYFDVGFYESWDIVPEKEGAKRDAEGAAMLHAMAEIFRDRDAQAKIEEIEKKEAEDEKRRQEYDKLEAFARESVEVWENESPWAPGCGPSVVVHWSELGALHEGSEEDAGEKGTPAKRYTLQAFDRITDDVDRYVKAHKDAFCYLKVRFTVEFGDELKDYTERIDLGDGDGGLLGMLRNIVKFHEEKGENDAALVGLYSGRLGYVREVLRRIEENVDDTPYRIEDELDGLEMA